MTLQSLEQQFDPETVSRIHALQDRLNRLQITYHASRYFVSEAERCLENGLLLAALLVSNAMLELLVRETLAQARMREANPSRDKKRNALAYRLLKEAEEDRALFFRRMVNELVKRSVLSSDEAELLRRAYSSTRNQLFHGIIGRFVRDRSPSPQLRDFIESTGLAHFSDTRDFEKIIKSQGVEELKQVFTAVETIVAKGAV